jgi:K+-sensing histidine kinase KdpD
MEETATSILQVTDGVSNEVLRESRQVEGRMVPKSGAAAAKSKSSSSKKTSQKSEEIARMRTIAHDLSNALEAILQASYLLGQSNLQEGPKRWAQLIDSSSQDAVRLNRELRRLLRSLSEE